MAIVVVIEFSDEAVPNELVLEDVVRALTATPLPVTPEAAHVAGQDTAAKVLALFDDAVIGQLEGAAADGS